MQVYKNAGFTLIELLVVIGMLGILISIIVPRVINARSNANNGVAQAYAHNVAVWIASGDAAATTSSEGSFAGNCVSSALQQEGAPPVLPGSVTDCLVDYANNHYTVTVTSVTGRGGPLDNGVFTATY